jgi:hypothetical protein
MLLLTAGTLNDLFSLYAAEVPNPDLGTFTAGGVQAKFDLSLLVPKLRHVMAV